MLHGGGAAAAGAGSLVATPGTGTPRTVAPIPSGDEVDGMRKFNTAGPVRAGRHYLVPPLERLDLAEVLGLVRDEAYFVLHAPAASRGS